MTKLQQYEEHEITVITELMVCNFSLQLESFTSYYRYHHDGLAEKSQNLHQSLIALFDGDYFQYCAHDQLTELTMMVMVMAQVQDQDHEAGQQQPMKEEEVDVSAAAAAAAVVDDDESGSAVELVAPETQNFLGMILPKFQDAAVMADSDAADEDFDGIAVLVVMVDVVG